MSFNTYGKRTFSSEIPIQVWAEVLGRKHGGGVIENFEELPVGAVVSAGTPVHLDRAGGTIKVLKTYEVVEDVNASAEIDIYSAFGLPEEGDELVIGEDEHTVSSVGEIVEGVAEVTLSEVATLKAGNVLAEKVDFVPNGLLWHDVVKEEGDTLGTGAVVDNGRVFADRIPPIPAELESVLTVKLERGI